MKLFSPPQAGYFCTNFTQERGVSEGSLRDFVNRRLSGRTIRIIEPSSDFNSYRALLLREAERNLFLAASQYRRCLDLMIPSSAHWAFVTSYYGNWYAANALLAMFGGCVIKSGNFVVDVAVGTPGSQEFSRRRVGPNFGEENVTSRGSHEKFWEIFYRSMIPFQAIVPRHLKIAITPISNDPFWQIQNRNQVNYHSHTAVRLIDSFSRTFNSSTFPGSLPGVLNTQYAVFEAITELAFHYAKQLGLTTDSLSAIGIDSLIPKVRRHVYRPPAPSLINKTRKKNIFQT